MRSEYFCYTSLIIVVVMCMKIFGVIIIFVIAVCGLGAQADSGEIIYIGTAEQFANIRELATGGTTFKLSADIELPADWHPFVFKGSLDGAGHSVTGFTRGLFLRVEDADIRNLVIKDVHVTVNGCVKTSSVGILAGEITRSVIENVQIEDSSVSANFTFLGFYAVGGLAGRADSSSVKNVVLSNSRIDVVNADMMKLFVVTGGLAGIVSNSVIENCQAGADVSSGGSAGGFVGLLKGRSRIEASCSRGIVSGEVNIGGFAGIISAAGAPNTITNCAAFSPAVIGPAGGNVRRFAGLLEHEGINGCHAYLGMAVIAGGKLMHVVPNAYGADGVDMRVKK